MKSLFAMFNPKQVDSKVKRLHAWASSLVATFEKGGGTNYIDEAIGVDREALELCPRGHPMRSVSLTQLSSHLNDRYKQLGRMMDLEEAIVLGREALDLCPSGHPDRAIPLDNLGVHLSARYKQLGRIEDLNKATILARDSLALRPSGHPLRSGSLNNLADRLSTRYNQLGGMEDISEAIVLARDGLALRPSGHPLRSSSLNNLAAYIYTRYKQVGGMEDINEAIVLARDALALRPLGHPYRSMSLDNLAAYLYTRYEQVGGMEDINEAIVLARDGLALRPSGHPLRSNSLYNLSIYLSTRCHKLGGMEDLSEAIVLDRDALALRPPGHPHRSASLNNLAVRLSTRHNKLGSMDDLNEAIIFDRDALMLRPLGHPDRSRSLENLACHLRTRFTRSKEPKDKEEIFSLYASLADLSQVVYPADLSAAREWIDTAKDFQHPTTLLAYQTSLRLLTSHVATLPSLPQHLTVLRKLTSSLAVDAFSASLRNDSPATAVELLEQGRGVFWSQLARLRSPLDDVIASGPAGKNLANEFTQLSLDIRNALHSSGANQHDLVCNLNIKLGQVVTRIRELPRHSRFLLPLLFPELRQAASGGPVVIMNVCKHGCDALIVSVVRDPVWIPLSVTKERVGELSSKLGTLTTQAKMMDVKRSLSIFLRELWDEIVSPIVNFLLTIHPPESRIWWCPTAGFTFLPLHAAGPYRKGQRNLADLYISSYTSTLGSLIRARQDVTHPGMKEKRFVAIGQATAVGQSKLVSVATELANVGQRVDGVATFTCIEGPESCIPRVSEELGKNQWVHLACHGLPNRKQPFESAFALHDGHFTVQRIAQCELENPEFAYLSACHTTVGDEESPDEVIHLASAMQFAGFRSVIGTMWAVDDGHANRITSLFYKYMKDESGHLDHTRAAFALNRTMKNLGDIPLDQRILYIHLGA